VLRTIHSLNIRNALLEQERLDRSRGRNGVRACVCAGASDKEGVRASARKRECVRDRWCVGESKTKRESVCNIRFIASTSSVRCRNKSNLFVLPSRVMLNSNLVPIPSRVVRSACGMCVCVCARARERGVCVCAYVCVYVCVCEREREYIDICTYVICPIWSQFCREMPAAPTRFVRVDVCVYV